MTKAEKGSNIYTKNKKIEIPAIKTKNNIDATGLGDTYIAAYTAKLDSNNIYEAGLYASIASKFKLESKGPLKVDEKLIQKELEKRNPMSQIILCSSHFYHYRKRLNITC